MSFQVEFPIQARPVQTHYGELKQPSGVKWVVWFYGGIRKNTEPGVNLPLITVCFREFQNGQVSKDYILRRVPITSLGQFSIGSIWENNTSRQSLKFPTFRFNEVNFDEGSWDVCSFYESAHSGKEPPFDTAKYPLAFKNDRNYYLRLTSNEGTLFIPCFEFLSRCYGRSAEIRRIISGHPWFEATDLIFAPLEEPEEPNKWKVRLRKLIKNSDAIFAAYIKYDRNTELKVKSIYSQIQIGYESSSYEASVFLKVEPWHEGKVSMAVRGIQLDERSFLALNVFGCSDPIGQEIYRDRENPNLFNNPAPPDAEGRSWDGAVRTNKPAQPEIVNIVSHSEPDHSGSTVEIHDEPFITLGTPRVVVDIVRDQAKRPPGDKKDIISDTFSGGQRHGQGKGVGYASEQAPVKLESYGILRDMWNSLSYMQQLEPSVIRSIDWFTLEKQYMSVGDPELIRLKPFDPRDQRAKRSHREWVYLSNGVPRGLMILRVKTPLKTVHICEVERRLEQDLQTEQNGQEFRGLVFIVTPDETIEGIVEKIMDEVRVVKGIVYKMRTALPKEHKLFKHKKAANEPVSGYAVAINALTKLGAIPEGIF